MYLKDKSHAVLSDERARCCIIKVIVGWIKKSVQEQHNRESDVNCTRSWSTYLRHGSTSKPRKVMWKRTVRWKMWGCETSS